MISLVSLLAAALSLQYCFTAAAIIHSKNTLDLQSNVAPKIERRLRQFVKITSAPPESVRLIPGTPLELSCHVISHPGPTVQWLKNGEPLPEYEDTANEIPNMHPSSIVQAISKLIVTTASNGDEFTCLASNGLKQKMASTIVYTTEDMPSHLMSALFEPSAPVIVYHYENILQNMGTSVVLPCRVASIVRPHVYWTDRDNKPIFDNSRVQMLPSGDLYISELEFTDMGNYTCTAQTVYGTTSAATYIYTFDN